MGDKTRRRGEKKIAMSTISDSKTLHESTCNVYEAVPGRLISLQKNGAFARREGGDVLLGNGFLTVRIPAEKGIIASVTSRLTD